MPYERIVQWAAGPVAALSGWLATQLMSNVSLFGGLGIGKNQLAHAIVSALTFGITALVTYAAHQKWLSNLVKWWDASGIAQPSDALPSSLSSEPDPGPVLGSNGHSPQTVGQFPTGVNTVS